MHNLNNLTVIIDYNKLQAFDYTKNVLDLEPLKEKWASFGWGVKEINGHDFTEIYSVLKSLPVIPNKPSCIIAHTIKGKGVSFMEDQLSWHYKSPNKSELIKALDELGVTHEN
jgi:transketolase